MATCDDPPVLLDAARLLGLINSSASLAEQKVTDSEGGGTSSEYTEDHTFSYEEDNDESNEDDEEEEGEVECECECEYDDEGEVIECYECYDDECMVEEEEEELNPCIEEDYDGPDIDKNMFIFRGSDESFVGSTLAERKKRRYFIGTHSFLDLADPHLEEALGTPTVVPKEGEDEGKEEEGEEEGEEGEIMPGEEGVHIKEEVTCITLKEEKDHYKQLCSELGIRPDPRVMASLRESVMNLRGMGMNSKEIAAVCKLLEKNKYVHVLILDENSVSMIGGMALAELIRKNKTIVEYYLSGTEILESFDLICDAIVENTVITHLDFSKNELEDVDMPAIKKILRGTAPLLVLNLNANFIRDDGVRHVGQGLLDNETLESIDMSHNKIKAEKKTAVFFTACAEHHVFRIIKLKRNFIGEDGGKAIGRVLANNPGVEILDVSFNLMDEGSAAAIGRSLGRLENRELKVLELEIQRWHQLQGAAVLQQLGNPLMIMPIELVDFGMMLDIHKEFIQAKERAIKLHPDCKIIHGQTFGMEHAKGPDHKVLLMKRANVVCQSFETPLVMLMEELAKEKHELTVAEFRKFIKQCNLYKDKSLTEAFEKLFPLADGGGVDAVAILESFDSVYPGLRVIPEPKEEEEEEEQKPKEEKKKKGKGKGGKGKEGGVPKAKGKGKKKK